MGTITATAKVSFRQGVLSRVVEQVCGRLPRQTSGLFISSTEYGSAEDYYIFDSNIRNRAEWRDHFRSYGGHHVSHDDTGFVVDPAEVAATHLSMRKNGKFAVGLFHTHRLLGPEFTKIDLDMHVDETLWHLIVSVVDPAHPKVRAYGVRSRSAYPLEIEDLQEFIGS